MSRPHWTILYTTCADQLAEAEKRIEELEKKLDIATTNFDSLKIHHEKWKVKKNEQLESVHNAIRELLEWAEVSIAKKEEILKLRDYHTDLILDQEIDNVQD